MKFISKPIGKQPCFNKQFRSKHGLIHPSPHLPPPNPAYWWTEDFWSKTFADFCSFNDFFCFCVVFGSLQTSLLCIMGESAGEGSVAVAVGVSDRWHVTHDKCNVKRDMWHLTHGTPFCSFFPFSVCFDRCGIRTTIPTRWEIQCLPYARILSFKQSKIYSYKQG